MTSRPTVGAPPPDGGLGRFRDAQQDVYDRALAELRGGRKQTHWMWFIFPQLAGLGHSATSEYFAIAGLEEARAYLRDPLLGPRLRECAAALLAAPTASATAILGYPDDLKLRSCATLFALVEPDGSVFHQILQRFFGGIADAKTVALVERAAWRSDG